VSAFIAKLNDSDRFADLCRQGFIAPILFMELLLGLGWYDVKIERGEQMEARLDGVRFTFGECP